jgi:hypothetical protein
LGFPTGWSFTTHKETSGAINHAPAANFLAPLPGRKVEDLCKGSFLHTHPLLCFIVLLYFIYFTCIVLYQKPKKLESLVVVISLLLVHHAVP